MSSQVSSYPLCKMNEVQQDCWFNPKVSSDLGHVQIFRHPPTLSWLVLRIPPLRQVNYHYVWLCKTKQVAKSSLWLRFAALSEGYANHCKRLYQSISFAIDCLNCLDYLIILIAWPDFKQNRYGFVFCAFWLPSHWRTSLSGGSWRCENQYSQWPPG